MDYLNDYLGEFESVIDNILNWNKVNPSDFKRIQLGRAFIKIEEFSSFTQDKEERQIFVNLCFNIINECEIKLIDNNYNDYESRISLLSDMKSKLQKVFPDIAPENKSLSIKAKIILIEYLGITKMLLNNGFNQKQQATLWSILFERSYDNTKKTLSRINGKIGVSGAIKDEHSLITVKKIISEFKMPSLDKLVETDLDKLNETREKKR